LQTGGVCASQSLTNGKWRLPRSAQRDVA